MVAAILPTLLFLSPLVAVSHFRASYDSKEGRCSLARQLIRRGLASRGVVGHWMCLVEVSTIFLISFTLLFLIYIASLAHNFGFWASGCRFWGIENYQENLNIYQLSLTGPRN